MPAARWSAKASRQAISPKGPTSLSETSPVRRPTAPLLRGILPPQPRACQGQSPVPNDRMTNDLGQGQITVRQGQITVRQGQITVRQGQITWAKGKGRPQGSGSDAPQDPQAWAGTEGQYGR